MAKTATVHIRVEPEIKLQVDNILNELGISTSEAINMFFRQVIRYKGIPLDLRIPTAETAVAIKEAEQQVNLHKCDDLNHLLKELNAD